MTRRTESSTRAMLAASNHFRGLCMTMDVIAMGKVGPINMAMWSLGTHDLVREWSLIGGDVPEVLSEYFEGIAPSTGEQ